MPNQERFFQLLSRVPRIEELWDRNKGELKIEQFETALTVMSSGEVQMAKFFAAIWLNDNKRYGFDIVDATAKINPYDRTLIAEWVQDPFWP